MSIYYLLFFCNFGQEYMTNADSHFKIAKEIQTYERIYTTSSDRWAADSIIA